VEKEEVVKELSEGVEEAFLEHGVPFPSIGSSTMSIGDVVKEIHASVYFPQKGNKKLIQSLEALGWKVSGKHKKVDHFRNVEYSGYTMLICMRKVKELK
jgi:hypothetical protein